MPADRQILAEHWEPPASLALLAERGWPEWTNARGYRISLRWNPHGNRPGWMWFDVWARQWIVAPVPDHTALCILRNHYGPPTDDAALLAALAATQGDAK